MRWGKFAKPYTVLEEIRDEAAPIL
jgi:hypothetical protein